MEKRVVKKCEEHLSDFKEQIKIWFEENNVTISGKQTTSDFLQFVYDFNTIKLTKDDFAKRKRIKNIVPQNERCCACRANGEQCTRRKKETDEFCGTHIKGTPHGVITSEKSQPTHKKVQIWAEEIGGIIRHLDKEGNVYDPQDIYQNSTNPKIIAKWKLIDNVYEIM